MSYPQAVSTGVQNLLETPKDTRKLLRSLTPAIRLLRVKRTAVAVSSLKRSKRFWAIIVILTVTFTTSIQNAAANYSIDHLRLYAHSRLLDYKEFQCFNAIINQESRWNFKAKNGSHYGLGQMRSKHYRDLDPYRQIDATIRYNQTRYLGQCKAWAFHLKHGYY